MEKGEKKGEGRCGYIPAGLHECLDTLEETYVTFLLQIIQHFLKTGTKFSIGERTGHLVSISYEPTCNCVHLWNSRGVRKVDQDHSADGVELELSPPKACSQAPLSLMAI